MKKTEIVKTTSILATAILFIPQIASAKIDDGSRKGELILFAVVFILWTLISSFVAVHIARGSWKKLNPWFKGVLEALMLLTSAVLVFVIIILLYGKMLF